MAEYIKSVPHYEGLSTAEDNLLVKNEKNFSSFFVGLLSYIYNTKINRAQTQDGLEQWINTNSRVFNLPDANKEIKAKTFLKKLYDNPDYYKQTGAFNGFLTNTPLGGYLSDNENRKYFDVIEYIDSVSNTRYDYSTKKWTCNIKSNDEINKLAPKIVSSFSEYQNIIRSSSSINLTR